MTLQMYLLEEKMEAEDRRTEEIALNLIRRCRPFQEILENSDLSLERIHQLVQWEDVSDNIRYSKVTNIAIAQWQTDCGL